MSRINHDRPQLRLLDNLKREFARYAEVSAEKPIDQRWPAYLRPVAEKPAALEALFRLFSSIEAWANDESINFSFSNPPGTVIAAYEKFLSARVYHRYDSSFSGRDWLKASDNVPRNGDDLREVLCIIFKNIPMQ